MKRTFYITIRPCLRCITQFHFIMIYFHSITLKDKTQIYFNPKLSIYINKISIKTSKQVKLHGSKNKSIKNHNKKHYREILRGPLSLNVYDFFQLFLAERFWSKNTHKLQKQPPEVFYEKGWPEAYNFIKKETLAQVFSCDFVKFLRTPSLQNTSGRLLLKLIDIILLNRYTQK